MMPINQCTGSIQHVGCGPVNGVVSGTGTYSTPPPISTMYGGQLCQNGDCTRMVSAAHWCMFETHMSCQTIRKCPPHSCIKIDFFWRRHQSTKNDGTSNCEFTGKKLFTLRDACDQHSFVKVHSDDVSSQTYEMWNNAAVRVDMTCMLPPRYCLTLFDVTDVFHIPYWKISDAYSVW